MDPKLLLRKNLDFIMGVFVIVMAICPMVTTGELLPLLLIIPAARLIIAAHN